MTQKLSKSPAILKQYNDIIQEQFGRGIIEKCLISRKIEGKPFVMPEMPSLLRERVARSLPFEFTGLDYVFGTALYQTICITVQ